MRSSVFPLICFALLCTVLMLDAVVGECSVCQTWGYDAQHTGVSSVDMSANQGGIAWSYVVAGSLITAPPAIDSSGHVICGDSNGQVVCLDAYDGHLVWMSHVPYAVESVPSIASNGTIYVTSNGPLLSTGSVGCLSALTANGEVLWSTVFNGSLSAPTISPEGVTYVCEYGRPNANDSALYAVLPNGSVLWRSTPRVTFCVSPAVGPDGTIYASFQNNPVIAFNPNGTVKWSALPISDPGTVDYFGYTGAMTIGPDGTVYAGFSDSNLTAYLPNGWVKWSVDCREKMGGIALAPDGTILACGRSLGTNWQSTLFALDPNGSLKWRFDSPSAFFGSPCISSDGLIFLNAPTTDAYVANLVIALTMDGKESWRMDGFGMWSFDENYAPITLGPNQTIYMPAMGYSSSALYAINVGRPTEPLLAIAKTESGHVRISWSAPPKDGGSRISSYEVYRAQLVPNSNLLLSDYELVASLDGNARSFLDRDVAPDQNGVIQYVYRVQATNTYGVGLPADINQIAYSTSGGVDWTFWFIVMLVVIVLSSILMAMLGLRGMGKRKL